MSVHLDQLTATDRAQQNNKDGKDVLQAVIVTPQVSAPSLILNQYRECMVCRPAFIEIGLPDVADP